MNNNNLFLSLIWHLSLFNSIIFPSSFVYENAGRISNAIIHCNLTLLEYCSKWNCSVMKLSKSSIRDWKHYLSREKVNVSRGVSFYCDNKNIVLFSFDKFLFVILSSSWVKISQTSKCFTWWFLRLTTIDFFLWVTE